MFWIDLLSARKTSIRGTNEIEVADSHRRQGGVFRRPHPRGRRNTHRFHGIGALFTLALGASATAQEPPDRQKLEAELQRALGDTEESEARAPTSPAPAGASPLRLLDISFDLLGAAGGSSAPEAELRGLQAGGHDPKNRGFTLQNVE